MHRVFIILLSLVSLTFPEIAAYADDAAIGAVRVVSVRTLRLHHTGNLSVDDQNLVIAEIRSHKYWSDDLDEIAERVRFAMQMRGYFNVSVDDPVFRVVALDRHNEIVDVMVSLDEGQIYRLASISFRGTFVLTRAELREKFPIADGDIFNREKIGHGLESLSVLYDKKGYVNFSAVPQTTIDEAQHTVTLLIDLDPGAVFHLGKLTVLGEESVPGARDKLLATWKHYEGRIYDSPLLTSFLRDLNARRSLRPEQAFEIFQDTQGCTINLQIRLVKPYTSAFLNR